MNKLVWLIKLCRLEKGLMPIGQVRGEVLIILVEGSELALSGSYRIWRSEFEFGGLGEVFYSEV